MERRCRLKGQSDGLAHPLFYAAQYGSTHLVKMILESGAGINEVSDAHQCGTALQVASYEGQGRVVQLLLDSSAEVDKCSSSYGTALQAATATGEEGIIEILLGSRQM